MTYSGPMNYAPARIQRLTRELSEELCLEYGAEQAARILEAAATEIRRADDSRTTRPAGERFHLQRGRLARVC
jgi:hypothetical protein